MASTINASTTSTSGLVYNADASGILQLQSNGVTGLTVETDASVTVNTVLQTANGRVEPLVLGTVQTASGTGVNFTGIPSWVKRITVMFNGVSSSGTSLIQIQLGSGSIITSGYKSGASFGAANATKYAAATSGFVVTTSGQTAALSISGSYVFNLFGSDIWVGGGNLGGDVVGQITFACAGTSPALSGALDRVRITTVNGTDTFDAGTVNFMYE